MLALTFSDFATEIGGILGVPTDQLHSDLDVYQDFGIDSLGLIAIGDRLEQAFSIKIPAAEMVTCFKLGDFYQVISRLLGDAVPAPAPTASLLLPADLPQTSDAIATGVADGPYATIDTQLPAARLRGTFVTPTEDGGLELLGWQRNIVRVQKMDVRLPTVIRLRLDGDGRVVSAGLDPSFAGSRGVLCYQPYVTRRLHAALMGKDFGHDAAREVDFADLPCFHVAEVVSDLVGALGVMRAKGMTGFFEQEATDAVQEGDCLVMHSSQEIRGVGRLTHRMAIDGAYSRIRFDENGEIYACKPLTVRTYCEDDLVNVHEVGGDTPTFHRSIIRATRVLQRTLAQRFGTNGAPLMCSNLSPRACIGGFVQAIAGKLYANNYTYILHCLSGLQRHEGSPRCVGGVLSQEEADTYFSGFDISAAIRGTA